MNTLTENAAELGYAAAERHRTDEGKARPLLPRLCAAVKALDRACASWNQRLREGQPVPDGAVWLAENQVFLAAQAREVREYLPKIHSSRLPRLPEGELAGYPRVYGIAASLILATGGRLSQGAVTDFVKSYQSAAPLTMGELWALDAVLRLRLIEELGGIAASGSGDAESVRECILSLRAVGMIPWKEFFEEASQIEQILREDPAGVYAGMDFASRDMYRHKVEELARMSRQAEERVARALVERAAGAPDDGISRHIGYYLIDDGAEAFQRDLGCRAPWSGAARRWALRHPEFFYLAGIELATFAVIGLLLASLSSLEPRVLAFFLLLLPATGAAVSFLNGIVTLLIPPRILPRLDFAEGIPAECSTMVVVPTLLLSAKFVDKLLEDLEVRFLANRDPQLSFALLTDFPDAAEPAPDDAEIVERCAEGIRRLNERYARYGRDYFYLFHRSREWNPMQFSFMGWERKRGKLIHFNNLLCGQGDEFQVKIGDLDALPRIRYVLTLDTDTQLPRDAARKLIATMAHPLNRPFVNPATGTVTRGYGILQPRVGISVHSAGRSRLARMYSGQTGIDLYTTAVSDVYQDLFGAGSYTGKGLYDVHVFQRVLSHRFPHDALLSHDLLEGEYARTALVSDVEVIDDYPSHYGAYSKRKHRWVRGDWQVVLWLLPRVPHYDGSLAPNPLPLISRWKIFDNLRRSVLEITTFILLLAGWFVLPGGPVYWTAAVLALMALPAWTEFLLHLCRLPPRAYWGVHFRELLFRLAAGHGNAALTLMFLPHQTLLMLDAICRTLVRTITRRRLLEWESAAEAERTGGAGLQAYLWAAAALALAIAAFGALDQDALRVAAPVLAIWILAPAAAFWLNASLPESSGVTAAADVRFLENVARQTWNYFRTFSTAEENWLIPDNVQTGDGRVAHRISPTNLGLLLNAQLAAADLGLIAPAELATLACRTLAAVKRMERYRGHFYNWYDTQTLAPMFPPYISTVDSGNLAASFLTLKQGCLEYAARCDSAGLRDLFQEMAETCSELFTRMDFTFLYDRGKKALSIGFDALSGRLEDYHYDLLASEARTASFLAIAKGDVPQEHWFHLGRTMTAWSGQRVLLSWSGTLFEYLMPLLWMKTWPGTLLDRSARAVIRCQRAYARKRRVPWGISESAFLERDAEGNYQYHAFGLPPVSLRRDHPEHLVIAPYAAALALGSEPRAALANLRAQAGLGWLGEYGFYDAVQFVGGRPQPVQAFMAHHLGMTLLAIDNALNRGAMRRRFHADPVVQAAELLLQERLPLAASVVKPLAAGGAPVIPFPFPETSEAAAG